MENEENPKTARSGKGLAGSVEKGRHGRKKYFAQTSVGNGKITRHARVCGAETAIL